MNYITTTKLNITYSVNILSQFIAKPIEIHWNETNGILLYLKGIISYGIKYIDSLDVDLVDYSNLDWVSNPDDKRSTLLYAFNIGFEIVAWSNKKQPTIFLSITKVEYNSLSIATCKLVSFGESSNTLEKKKKWLQLSSVIIKTPSN